MKGKKTLASLAMAGAITLMNCRGKINDDRYDFNGLIGNEQIFFERGQVGEIGTKENTNYLTVTREDGKTVIYIDFYNDLKLDQVRTGGETYLNYADGKPVLKIAQQQFDSYLRKILEYKKKNRKYKLRKALDSIR